MASELETATFVVVDTETTGLNPRTDRVVELAYVVVRGGKVVRHRSTFVHPERTIPPEATAVHGIRDEDVAGAPPLRELEPELQRALKDAVLVAHNARFDLGFLPFLADRPVVCTMRLAMHLVCSPNYKNATLARVLELASSSAHGPTHRALADASLTAELLIELVHRYGAQGRPPTIADLVEMIAQPARLRRLTFGRHKGTPISQVPSDYLEWILSVEPPMWPDVCYSAELELARRTTTSTAAATATSSPVPQEA